ncbi:MAG: hypothetical protein AAFP98_07575 [Pseudomonadota bacterium]
MFSKIAALLGKNKAGAPAISTTTTTFDNDVLTINADPYLRVADPALRLISVFDDLKYDRADLDMMSGPMRNRALSVLQPLGVRQESGAMFVCRAADVRLYLPKFRALGASPFDATRDTTRRAQDYYILTPTQTACQLIDNYPIDDAVEKIKTLIAEQPVNLLRILDFLDKSDRHQTAKGAIGHLMYVQRLAIQTEPLCRRRALR